ncbi:MAG: gamma-glutamylcyclotransferase family protein [Dehalococcoidia bacterium]|nr:gamma-glutamylcyclotransferase family protein [Dehalococcoidia bacterium]
MSDFGKQRYCGVEDEYRIATIDGRQISVDQLIAGSPRFFFDEAGHVPLFAPAAEPDSAGGRIWTWYGGTLYNDYDELGTLVEATTPLTPVGPGVESLVDNVLTHRTQLVELAQGESVLGVSTHLNLLLDSRFQGKDLCDFTSQVPSNAFASTEAQKLGADIALIATHTISPVIAYLLFNHRPLKGALYRPRRNRRMELCLPYVPEPDQMRAGFLFWFAAVDAITDLIKADLSEGGDWERRFSQPDYYKQVLTRFPFVVSDIRFKRPSYYLGYEIGSDMEENVMENGSKAVIQTQRGPVNVVELARRYVEFISARLRSLATAEEMALLDDFLNRRRELSVDVQEQANALHLGHDYVQRAAGSWPRSYLNHHQVDELASVHLKFLRSPYRLLKPASRVSPGRLLRNTVRELDWDCIDLELVEENEGAVRRYLLAIPLAHTDSYLKLEENLSTVPQFLDAIKPWIKDVEEIANPRAIFAYGTLMDPERDRRSFSAIVTSVRAGYAYGEAYDFGDYPVLVERNRTGVVRGVLLSLLDFEESAGKFDLYEGCHQPNPQFVRVLRQVMLDNFENTLSWVYVGNGNNRLVREKLKTAPRVTGLWAKGSMRTG